ncbi:hypothetical protein ABW20_dc0108772 [Dactylellina cionopaga]|nr:hypothetical protein ABW20_dc0108772 [Dactylellina cionopaga]
MPLMPGTHRRSASANDESDEEMREQIMEKDTEVEEEDEERDQAEDDEGGSNLEPEYTVEKILGHKWDEGILMYKVKWKGYEKKADQTWEPEDTLADVAALDQYLETIGGKPSRTPGKRGRKSTNDTATPVPKKNRIKQENPSAHLKEEEWDPPAGNWEDEIRLIETLERNGGDHICYVQWVNGWRSQHPLHVIYQRCPQKMLKFYESHL